MVRETGSVKNYLAFTDNIGSILSIMDENTVEVFDAEFPPSMPLWPGTSNGRKLRWIISKKINRFPWKI